MASGLENLVCLNSPQHLYRDAHNTSVVFRSYSGLAAMQAENHWTVEAVYDCLLMTAPNREWEHLGVCFA